MIALVAEMRVTKAVATDSGVSGLVMKAVAVKSRKKVLEKRPKNTFDFMAL